MTEDRISALPDDLLVTILLLIPIKEAVATMILSKRWRFIWTMMSALVYEDDDHDDDDGKSDDEESKKSIWGFLNKSMELHKAPVLELLTIKLGPRCPADANIGECVETAVKRGLCKLDFKLRRLRDPIRLPESLYTCRTLKHLALTHEILVDFPSFNSCLPSLIKILLHSVVYKDDASLVNLLSSCPVLKYLFVIRIEDDNVAKFTVKMPSLLVLWYDDTTPFKGDYDESTSLVVDTPSLTKFHISINPRDSFTIEGNYVPETCSERFFKSVSNVLFLGLVLSDEMMVHCSNIKFPRLIKCRITPCESAYWMDSLLLLLNNTPKLKHFIVDYIFTYDDHPQNASASWMERSFEPVCLSTSLEKFKVLNCKGRVEEKELAKYILQNSKCLKKTTISFKSTVKHKDTMMEELKALPRVSIASHLFFKT